MFLTSFGTELLETLRRMFAIPDFSNNLIPDFIAGTSIRNSLFVAFLLIILMIIIGIKLKKANPLKRPGKLIILAEKLVKNKLSHLTFTKSSYKKCSKFDE